MVMLGIVASRYGRSRNGRVRNGRSRIGRSRNGTSTSEIIDNFAKVNIDFRKKIIEICIFCP